MFLDRSPLMMEPALMIESLHAYIANFAGYGGLRAPLWFVGMEEGGGRDVEELTRRVDTWSSRGRAPLEDLASYHRAIGLARHFEPPVPLQRTWAPLIRVLQAWRGAPVEHETLRHVQATELGAHGGPATLLELLPLPANNTQAWPYGSLAESIPALADRLQYRAAYEAERLAMVRTLIRTGAPRAVVCYGLSYLDAWTELAGTELHAIDVEGRRCYAGDGEVCPVIAVPHPVSHGTSSRCWEGLGLMLRARTVR